MQAQRNPSTVVAKAADKLAEAKALAEEVLEAWATLPEEEHDASSGELEQAIQLLGRVTDDLDRQVGALKEKGK